METGSSYHWSDHMGAARNLFPHADRRAERFQHELTLLARCLDLAQRKLHPDRCLPDNLIVQVDNTTRESKNQHFGLFLSYLTGKVFKSIECHYLQVLHTKNELDQRFSTLSSLIKQADSIEDLSDLQDYMSKNMTSALKRELIVEIIPNTNHLWRFCRRSDIVSGQIDESDLKVAKKDDSDVVLTVKQWMSSVEPSQGPVPSSFFRQRREPAWTRQSGSTFRRTGMT